MKVLLVLPLFIAAAAAGQSGSPLPVKEYQWFRDYKQTPPTEPKRDSPARALIPENKKFRRDARAETSPRADDPSDQTVDGRSEALEKVVESSRTAKGTGVQGFRYKAKLHNLAAQPVEVVFLEFQFTEIARSSNIVHRQFLCAVRIKPEETAEISVFSSLGPSDVISVESLSNENRKLFDSAVNINRIEYANGSILQREDWNYRSLRSRIDGVTATPWGTEQCRGF